MAGAAGAAMQLNDSLSDEDLFFAEDDKLLGAAAAARVSAEHQEKKPVSVFGLVVISFFWVCGGIYGAEEILAAAPPRYVFAAMVFTPVLFGLPAALMNAELSTAFPVTGGYVVWVEHALGKTIGVHNSVWRWITCVLDAALYPQFVAKYTSRIMPVGPGGEQAIALVMVGAIMVINLGGVEWMMKMEAVLGGISLLPTVVFVAWGASRLRLDVLLSPTEPCCRDAMGCKPSLPGCHEASLVYNATHSAMCVVRDEHYWAHLSPPEGLGLGGIGRAVCNRHFCGELAEDPLLAISAESSGQSMPPLELEACSEFEGDVQWSHLFSWTLWLYGGIFGAHSSPRSALICLSAFDLHCRSSRARGRLVHGRARHYGGRD